MKYSFENNNVISCEDYAKEIKAELKASIPNLPYTPTLAIIQVGNNPASNSYIKGKKNDCVEVGMEYEHCQLNEDISEEELISLIEAYNNCPEVHGIIVQMPLPEHLDARKISYVIAKEKDVDGFRIDSCLEPCTPKGIVDWLTYNNYEFEGKNAVVLGRSEIVGKPLINMLIDRGATVTCCNSKTQVLEEHTSYCDLLISAIGKPKMIDNFYIARSNVIVDVGINRDEDGKLCGDVNREDILRHYPNYYITPVPKGVGLLTRVALLQNTIEAFHLQLKMEDEELCNYCSSCEGFDECYK